MPNGSLLKQYLPNGVKKAVSGWDFLDKGIICIEFAKILLLQQVVLIFHQHSG